MSLELHDVDFAYPGRPLAVDGVSLTLGAGESLALVGESGAGKSTLARLVVGTLRPSRGRIEYGGEDVASRALRRRIQLVWQDAEAALDPRLTVHEAIAIGIRWHGLADPDRRVGEWLDRLELPRTIAKERPHALSGGQRQRVGLVRALAVEPELLILDEPVAALDASTRAGVVRLLARLRAELRVSLLLISHDLATVEALADRVHLMFAGRILERAPSMQRAVHPYARALLAAARFEPGPEIERPPAPEGCPYAPRCPERAEACRAPVRLESLGAGHEVACVVELGRRKPGP